MQEALEWKKASFSANEAIEWHNRDFTIKIAAEWKKSGYSPAKAKEWVSDGWSLKGVQKITKMCSKGLENWLKLAQSNPYDVKGRCFQIATPRLQLLSRTTALFKGYPVIYIDFGSESVPQFTFDGIVRGEGAYKYVTVAGDQSIIPKLKVINFTK